MRSEFSSDKEEKMAYALVLEPDPLHVGLGFRVRLEITPPDNNPGEQFELQCPTPGAGLVINRHISAVGMVAPGNPSNLTFRSDDGFPNAGHNRLEVVKVTDPLTVLASLDVDVAAVAAPAPPRPAPAPAAPPAPPRPAPAPAAPPAPPRPAPAPAAPPAPVPPPPAPGPVPIVVPVHIAPPPPIALHVVAAPAAPPAAPAAPPPAAPPAPAVLNVPLHIVPPAPITLHVAVAPAPAAPAPAPVAAVPAPAAAAPTRHWLTWLIPLAVCLPLIVLTWMFFQGVGTFYKQGEAESKTTATATTPSPAQTGGVTNNVNVNGICTSNCSSGAITIFPPTVTGSAPPKKGGANPP